MIVDNTYTSVDDSYVTPMTAGNSGLRPQKQSIFSVPNQGIAGRISDSSYSGITSTKIHVAADQIVVDGTPLDEILAGLQKQIALLRPAFDLHTEYTELRDLYNQYNKKLDEIREKQKMWENLKK